MDGKRLCWHGCLGRTTKIRSHPFLCPGQIAEPLRHETHPLTKMWGESSTMWCLASQCWQSLAQMLLIPPSIVSASIAGSSESESNLYNESWAFTFRHLRWWSVSISYGPKQKLFIEQTKSTFQVSEHTQPDGRNCYSWRRSNNRM